MVKNVSLITSEVTTRSSNFWIGTPPNVNVRCDNDDNDSESAGTTTTNTMISDAVLDWVVSLSLEVDEETLLNSSKPSSIPMYKRHYQDIVDEKNYFYKGLFESFLMSNPHLKERVTSENIMVTGDDNTNIDNKNNNNKRIIPVTIFWPSKSCRSMERVCVHCHGGGWLFGDSKHQVGERLLQMSTKLQAPVISVEYRMGPNHPYPDPVDDVQHVLERLLLETTSSSSRTNETSTDVNHYCYPGCSSKIRKLVASGESAGAHLLLLAIIRLAKAQPQLFTGKQSFIMALNLVYGVYDLSGTESLKKDYDKSAPLSGKELQWMMNMHIPPSLKQTPKHPDISPLYVSQLDDNNNIKRKTTSNILFPPALFTVGTADPLMEDTVRMACHYYETFHNYDNNIKHDTPKVQLAIYAGGQHGIGHFGMQQNISLGQKAREHTEQFLSQFLNKNC